MRALTTRVSRGAALGARRGCAHGHGPGVGDRGRRGLERSARHRDRQVALGGDLGAVDSGDEPAVESGWSSNQSVHRALVGLALETDYWGQVTGHADAFEEVEVLLRALLQTR